MAEGNKTIADLSLSIDRDVFLRNLLRELSGTLEDVVGLDEAAGFVSIVGQHIGEWMDREYRAAIGTPQLNLQQVSDVLVDLKKRIQGGFGIESMDQEKIVLANTACPFGDAVQGRPSLCMMTSNVFGTVTAENMGYARVCLNKTIANGDGACMVTIYLNQDNLEDPDSGREYFKS
ncbi:MAG: methanogen output domain 1-containing protein [Gammaproteobacteria bacterium]|nr:methanogen output domain 1-containing protein [Gammaproteobacteria bacterium]